MEEVVEEEEEEEEEEDLNYTWRLLIKKAFICYSEPLLVAHTILLETYRLYVAALLS